MPVDATRPKKLTEKASTPSYPYGRRARLLVGHPFLSVIALLLLMVAFGTGGYMIIEGWGLLDESGCRAIATI